MQEAHSISDNTCSVCGYIEEILPITDVPVGAYIEYAPSNATVTVLATDSGADSDQRFTTSSYTNGWKVFKNNEGQIDIISAESVGNLTLQGATGYAKAVYTLNKMSSDYVNPAYATSGRSIGYVEGSSMEIIDTTTYPLTWENTSNLDNGFPYGDGYYTSDQTIINTAVDGSYPLRHTGGNVWLASRFLVRGNGGSSFQVRCLSNVENYASSSLYSSTPYVYSRSFGVRPVVSLKSGLKIIDGEGTSSSPYVISF